MADRGAIPTPRFWPRPRSFARNLMLYKGVIGMRWRTAIRDSWNHARPGWWVD